MAPSLYLKSTCYLLPIILPVIYSHDVMICTCMSSILHMWFSKPSLPSFLHILVSTYPASTCLPSYLSSVLHVLQQIYPPTSPLSSSPDTAENVFQSNLIHKNILAFQPPISTLLNLHFILCYCSMFNGILQKATLEGFSLWGVLMTSNQADSLYCIHVGQKQSAFLLVGSELINCRKVLFGV